MIAFLLSIRYGLPTSEDFNLWLGSAFLVGLEGGLELYYLLAYFGAQ